MTFPYGSFRIREIEVSNRLVMAPLHEITDRGSRSAIAAPEARGSGRKVRGTFRSRAARRLV